MIERWVRRVTSSVEARMWQPDAPLNNADIFMWLTTHDIDFKLRSSGQDGRVILDLRCNGAGGPWLSVAPGCVLIRDEEGDWSQEDLIPFLDKYNKEDK